MRDAELGLVVVSHNTRAILAEALKRLSRYPEVEVLVVDTASSDGSPEEALRWNRRLLQVENRGYAYAVNRGLEALHNPVLGFMNSDVFLEAGDLEALLEALTLPRVGPVGPLFVDAHGRLPSFGPLYAPYRWNLRQPRAVPWISGALMLFTRTFLEKVGPLDEGFFFYNEDLEWCLRARRQGYRVMMVPRRVVHLGGASTPSQPAWLAEGYRGGLRLSARYYPKFHGLHRKWVYLEASIGRRWSPSSLRRQAYALIAGYLARGELDHPWIEPAAPN
jgi:N-acetylglucosaminyl-diphospho-decaprenol L-rhamnosyltransferase